MMELKNKRKMVVASTGHPGYYHEPIQMIPASGWYAVFKEEHDGKNVLWVTPVIAWCLCRESYDDNEDLATVEGLVNTGDCIIQFATTSIGYVRNPEDAVKLYKESDECCIEGFTFPLDEE
jgi:hypothetical protein